MLFDVIVIKQIVTNENVHHGQHHRHIGSGQRLNKNISGFCGDGFQWVNHDDLGTVGSRLFNKRPEVSIDESCVCAPEQNQLRVLNVHRIIGQGRSESES